jgi:hypothetical protein
LKWEGTDPTRVTLLRESLMKPADP